MQQSSMKANCSSGQPLRQTLRRAIPIALQPKIIALKNRLFRRHGPALSDTLAAILTLSLMVGLYVCCSTTITEWHTISGSTDLTASLVGGALGALFVLVLLSSSVTAISCLFVSRDIERLLVSPLSPKAFLISKVVEVGAASIWMLAIFFIPLYVAFGVAFDAHALYFCVTPLLVVSLLAIAVLLGSLVALIFSAIIPVRMGRNILVALFVIALGMLLASLRLLPGDTFNLLVDTQESSRLGISLLHARSVPTYWVGASLRELLGGGHSISSIVLITALPCIMMLWKILLITFTKLYRSAYSKLQDHRPPLRLCSSTKRLLLLRRGIGRDRRLRALMTREFFSFTRDITHTIQLAMLLAICILYLYSLQTLQPPTHVGTTTLQLWDMCTILSSLVLSSIIILSICARFVFPSVSLEGQSLWILQAAPMRSREILRAKHVGWFIPTALMSAVIFSSGGFALGLAPLLIVTLVAAGVILSYGLVALGVGIGARFARFDWEHPTELSTSWGNLIYTGCGLLALILSLIPLTIMFGLFVFVPAQFSDSGSQLLLVATSLGAVSLIHVIIGEIMLRIGTRALDDLQKQ